MEKRNKKIAGAVIAYTIVYLICLYIVLFTGHDVFWGRVLGAFIGMTVVNIWIAISILLSSLQYYYKNRHAKNISVWAAISREVNKLLTWK